MPKKFYVVWKGKEPGIYDSWDDCRRQVEGERGAKYKSFVSLQEAKQAYAGNPVDYLSARPQPMDPIMKALYGKPVTPSIAVDGACSGKTRDADYQGVDVETGVAVFRKGPFADGTNNVMEFLAIVHALAYCRQQQLDIPIYSDSANAIKWVLQKKAATKLEHTARNAVLFELIARAESWLQTNTWPNQLLKWETKVWGEITADFGRK